MPNSDRSLAETGRVSGAGEIRHTLDGLASMRDPGEIAVFCLGLGYEEDNVVNTLVRHCRLDRLTAQRIVADAALPLQGGSSHA